MNDIRQELTFLADTLCARGIKNKHDIPWPDLLEEEFGYWIVQKFENECGYTDLLERKARAAFKGEDDGS